MNSRTGNGADPGGAGVLDEYREIDRPCVLVIEDDLHDWEIYGKILWYNGFDVLYAGDGQSALRLARDYQPDIVLIDLGLPDIDGLDLCRELHRDPETREIPTVALTGRARREFEQRACDAGCVLYLEKPIRPTAVLFEIERLIGRAPPPGDGQPPLLHEA